MYGRPKLSSVWRLDNQPMRKHCVSVRPKVSPYLFSWKRAKCWRNSMNRPASASSSNSSLSLIGRKLLLSRNRTTIYTKSPRGFSLRISKVLSVGGSSLKWSKSIERNSKKANEEATLAVAAAQKEKREHHGTNCAITGTKIRKKFSRKSRLNTHYNKGVRIFRIGLFKYRMDPSRRTLQRISDDSEPSTSLTPEKEANKPSVPRRLLIDREEYVRIGNGNQLVRYPKKRTRIFANEKVRWSLHSARLRSSRKRKYCQFFTRFGKCNKGDEKCPFIHDPSKIAVCTKFLNGSCSDPKCKLTHEVIPERMQDCSYFLQGLCANEHCPYRHVNVNANASVCEGFLKGYCADGNECQRKHTYACPTFEATGICEQGSKCKLHHPRNRSRGVKRKERSMEQPKNPRGRYFGFTSPEVAERIVALRCNQYNGDLFCQEGKFADFIRLDFSDKETGDTCDLRDEQRAVLTGEPLYEQVEDVEELIKPMRIVNSCRMTEALRSVNACSIFSEDSDCCK